MTRASRPARSLRCRVAAWIYAGMAIPSFVLGAIYLFRPTFMPYHAVALSKEWAELDAATQVLIKGLMEVAGGGWLALGTLTLLLALVPIRRGERWARWALPIASLLLYVPTLFAALSVLEQTPATPPWYGNLLVCVASVFALILDAPWQPDQRRDQNGRAHDEHLTSSS
jgi:ABC-type Fe3+ transport system permease subunit